MFFGLFCFVVVGLFFLLFVLFVFVVFGVCGFVFFWGGGRWEDGWIVLFVCLFLGWLGGRFVVLLFL